MDDFFESLVFFQLLFSNTLSLIFLNQKKIFILELIKYTYFIIIYRSYWFDFTLTKFNILLKYLSILKSHKLNFKIKILIIKKKKIKNILLL
ncbi:hypothetical protein pb186bvf_013808 [Paramecium bursaria]